MNSETGLEMTAAEVPQDVPMEIEAERTAMEKKPTQRQLITELFIQNPNAKRKDVNEYVGRQLGWTEDKINRNILNGSLIKSVKKSLNIPTKTRTRAANGMGDIYTLGRKISKSFPNWTLAKLIKKAEKKIGRNLSGSEKSLISLARSCDRNNPVVIEKNRVIRELIKQNFSFGEIKTRVEKEFKGESVSSFLYSKLRKQPVSVKRGRPARTETNTRTETNENWNQFKVLTTYKKTNIDAHRIAKALVTGKISLCELANGDVEIREKI